MRPFLFLYFTLHALGILFALSGRVAAGGQDELEAVLLLADATEPSPELGNLLGRARELAAGPGPLADLVARARESAEDADPVAVALGRSACLALAGDDGSASLQSLALALLDEAAPASLRERALAALHVRRDPRSLLAVAAILERDHGVVREIDWTPKGEAAGPWLRVRQALDPELPLKEGAAALLARFAAAGDLATHHRRRAARALLAAIEGQSPGSRIAALRSVGSTALEVEDRSAALAALRRLWRTEGFEDVRAALACALGAIGEPPDAAMLEEGLAGRPPVAAACRRALTAIGRRGSGLK